MTQKQFTYIPRKVYLPVVFALVLVTGFILGLHLRQPGGGNAESSFFSVGVDRYDKVNDVINYINDAYVDSVSRQHLTEETIRSMLQNLDPHSSYIPASEFQRMNDPLLGSFEGIGIEFNMIKDTVVVIDPIAGGPSEEAGIMPGDRIVKVEDTVIAGVNMATSEVVDMLLGEKGTTVDVTVYRPGVSDLLEFSLTRDEIPTYSLDIAYMVDDSTGYIRLNKFSATTHQEFSLGVNRLKEEGMEELVLDLRGNGGGFLDAAIHVADELLAPNELIVYTEGRSRPRSSARARREGSFEQQPLVVLIDQWSASASEIVAGAVQDNDRGLVVGRRSFGKGLVQEQVELGDGSALRLTVARYYTPTGRSIQKPYEEGEEAYFDEFIERYENGEMLSPDSIDFDDSLRFETPGGRTVYGGGGIMPDIFVPMEMHNDNGFYEQVSRHGHIYMFAFNYADNYRDELEALEDASTFIDTFTLTDAIYNDFLAWVAEQGTTIPQQIDSQAEEMIRTNLKAYIGRNTFGAEAFFPVLHNVDRGFNKALEALHDEDLQDLLTPKEEAEPDELAADN